MFSRQPQVGDHYRNVDIAFRNAEWILNDIFIDRAGIEHAHLISASDATDRKTLAVSVIVDPRRFILAEVPGKIAGGLAPEAKEAFRP